MGSLPSALIMKNLITAVLVISLSNLSLQFYSPPIERVAPEPVCRQVPKQVCNKFLRLLMNLSPRKIVEVSLTQFVLTSRNVSARSLRDLSRRPSPESSVGLSLERTARLP